MATAFLSAMGVDGNVGTITMDAASGTATAGDGHTVRADGPGKLIVSSARWPFCAPEGAVNTHETIRAGMALTDFNNKFNRFQFKVNGLTTPQATVTWGSASKDFTAAQLQAGINLAAEFPVNPFSAPFEKLWNAIAARQAYETKQIKDIFHGSEGKADMEAAVKKTEAERAPLAAAVKAAIHPLEHAITLTPKP